MEHALQKAARSRYGVEHDIRASIDSKTGEMTLKRVMTVVDEACSNPRRARSIPHRHHAGRGAEERSGSGSRQGL